LRNYVDQEASAKNSEKIIVNKAKLVSVFAMQLSKKAQMGHALLCELSN
jgi:hypothetical protein